MQRSYSFGVTLVVIGSVFLSFAGILLRNVESASGWQILFYRGLAFSATLLVILLLKYHKNTLKAFKKIGLPGLWAAIAFGLGSIFYIFAILYTTVANALFIIGASPLAAAFVGWLVLGERTSRFGIVAMFASLCGIGLMFVDGLIEGRWLGNVAALMVVVTFVIYLLIVRNHRQIDMLPATCLGGLVISGIAGLFVESFSISNHDLVIAIIMGSVQLCIGFLCFTIAARYILASEVALFALTESIVGPIWVWIGVGEQPSTLTLFGSGVVLVSVSAYCIAGIRSERGRLKPVVEGAIS